MAKGDPIEPENHVSRYCSPKRVENGVPLASAFEMSPGHDHLSINWLEYFEVDNMESSIDAVRQAFVNKQFKLKEDGKFAVLNVGSAKESVRVGAEKEIRILKWPNGGDDSHSGIFDYTSQDLQVAVDLHSLITSNDVFLACP